jgi:hypothetical protein
MSSLTFRQYFRRKPRIIVASLLALAAVGFAIAQVLFRASHGANTEPAAARIMRAESEAPLDDSKASPGYTLFAPLSSNDTYLIDMKGRVVNTWAGDRRPAQGAFLLENGHMLRPGVVPKHSLGFLPAAGGAIQEYTWEGELVWDYTWRGGKQMPHHDICKLPNGNVLMILAETKTAREVLAAGRQPHAKAEIDMLSDCIFEIKPTGKTTGAVVWEWHLWDHLIQDYDHSRANYANVAAHPELVDVNFGKGMLATLGASADENLKKLRSLGYVGSTVPAEKLQSDWTHTNSVAYSAELDQIMLSVRNFSEIWIIDHSTTTAQAAGHSGGRSGKGGDLLYRWGNPQAYRAGTAEQQQLAAQHDAHWIPRGLPGAGHVLVFNNGSVRPGEEHPYSSVDELVLPVDGASPYALTPGKPYGPDRPVWSYYASDKATFYAPLMSSSQRLANGNTLICWSTTNTILEVTPEREIVWKYHTLGGPSVADAGEREPGDWWSLVGGSISDVEPMLALGTPPFTILGAFAATADQKVAPRGHAPSPDNSSPWGVASIFRARRYASDYPGLAGKNLKPDTTAEPASQANRKEKTSPGARAR